MPVVVFPTSKGRFFEYEDRGMVDALTPVLTEGRYQLFCVDSMDSHTWHNLALPPRERVLRHVRYEQHIIREILPLIQERHGGEKICVTGCSFGGFHSVNFTLRHPQIVAQCISLSGSFDTRPLLDGYFDEDCYFNNPVEYLPNLSDEWYLQQYRSSIEFVLAAGEWDFSLDSNLRLSRIFDTKGIRHWLDVWGDHTRHDWPWWQMMIKKFLV
jgi:esterase/lipase superfamily enzyme